MVRDDDVDTGLWKSVDKSKLLVPMDVHMAEICKKLKFCRPGTVNLKSATEATKCFSRIKPDDPVKYDFVLCRLGMLGHSDVFDGNEEFSGVI